MSLLHGTSNGKRRYQSTNLRCVKYQKSAEPMSEMSDVSDLAKINAIYLTSATSILS